MAVTESRRRGRPPRHNRSELLAAAAAVVVQRGYEGLRYQDVSDATGVAIASLRHYFPTVDGLRKEALCQQVRVEMHGLASAMEHFEDPWQSLLTLIDVAMGRDVEERTSWLVWLEYWRAAARDPVLVADADLVEAEWLAMTERQIARGVESGRFRLDQDLTGAARELTLVIDGAGPTLAIDPSAETAVLMRERVLHAVRRMLGLAPDATD